MSRALSRQLAEMGIRDPRVLKAMAEVPRHLFVPPALRSDAEANRPLPIGQGQTISQPFIVAYMTEALELDGSERVLEVGTGSGYQSAVLALLAREVFSVEIVPELAASAAELLLRTLALPNVRLRVGDGRRGWPEAAPFDRVLVTAAPAEIPPALIEQLAPGGRMIVPVGADPEVQQLELVVRGVDGVTTTTHLIPVRFVPLTGGGNAGP
ncbi:MAG TPA: protein-L-isoaspartate(D-aspartate) O-methyltransferase [Anaeromyxobacteraceae bacterium]|nr:protein-L-isoaspartate(D-aspartate) O-methyltransferase [Anaeromyxobacteraceae bacterium]